MPFTPDKKVGFIPDAQEEEGSVLEDLGGAALGAVGEVGQFLDRYTGAPTRAAISSLMDNGTDISGAASAFGNQFGDDPTKAPTGQDIARDLGAPDTALSEVAPFLFNETGKGLRFKKGGPADVTASGAAGLAVDIAADPTNLIPGKTIAQGLSKGAGVVGRGAAKVASSLSGIPAQTIKTYATHMPEINKAIGRYGKDIASAADDTRTGYNTAIKSSRRKLNQQITDSLATSGSKTINIDDMYRSLNDSKAALNPALHAGEIAEIDELIKMTDSIRGAHGQSTLKDFFDLQEVLRDRAKGAYQKSGQIFMPGSKAQRAAKQASAIARKSINEASPEIAAANNRLSLMHSLEDKMNKNLIGEGRPEGALLSVGSGSNARGRKQLGRLGELTGTDMVGEAEKLSAQRAFTNPDLLPVDQTGKSATRMAVGAGLGYLSGIPGASFAVPAAMSPAAIKLGMNAGAPILNGAKKLGRPGYVSASAAGRNQNNSDRDPGHSPEGVVSKLQRSPNGSKFIGAIQKAKERGPDSFSAIYYLLWHSEPDFKKAVDQGE